MADTIGVMYLGKLVEIGPARDVYDQRRPPLHQGLLDAIPVPDADVGPGSTGAPSGASSPRPSPRRRDAGSAPAVRAPRTICAEEEPPLRPFGDGTSPPATSPSRRRWRWAAATRSSVELTAATR